MCAHTHAHTNTHACVCSAASLSPVPAYVAVNGFQHDCDRFEESQIRELAVGKCNYGKVVQQIELGFATPTKDYTQNLSKFRINRNQALDMEITKDLETGQCMLLKEKSQHPCLY